MKGQVGLKRALGQNLTEQGDFEEDFFVFFGDFPRGLQPLIHPANGIGATFFHRPFYDAFCQIAVSTVHINILID